MIGSILWIFTLSIVDGRLSSRPRRWSPSRHTLLNCATEFSRILSTLMGGMPQVRWKEQYHPSSIFDLMEWSGLVGTASTVWIARSPIEPGQIDVSWMTPFVEEVMGEPCAQTKPTLRFVRQPLSSLRLGLLQRWCIFIRVPIEGRMSSKVFSQRPKEVLLLQIFWESADEYFRGSWGHIHSHFIEPMNVIIQPFFSGLLQEEQFKCCLLVPFVIGKVL